MIESQFAHTKPKPKLHASKRNRKHFDVKVLPDRKAKGRYPKGSGFNKRVHIKGRQPTRGDNMLSEAHIEDTMYWLRVKRS